MVWDSGANAPSPHTQALTVMYKLSIAILVALIFPNSLLADQPRSSNLSIWAENNNVLVLHEHKVRAWTISQSSIRIINKGDGSEVFQSETTPFTVLVPVEGGKYFAGLSDLQAGSLPHGYNFALFKPDGEFVSRVYVSKDTDYCEKVRQSVSQYLGWFSRVPDIHLERSQDGQISSIIVQAIYHDAAPCNLPIGDHLFVHEGE